MQTQKNQAMNNKLFDNKWTQIRSQTTSWWSLMRDYDLIKVDKAAVKFDKYVTMLQVKYGYSKEQARREISRHVTEYEAEQSIIAGLHDPANALKTEKPVRDEELLENDSLGG